MNSKLTKYQQDLIDFSFKKDEIYIIGVPSGIGKSNFMANTQLNKRCSDLTSLKMKFNGSEYFGYEDYNCDFNVHTTEITCLDDKEWDELIQKMRTELNRRMNDNNN